MGNAVGNSMAISKDPPPRLGDKLGNFILTPDPTKDPIFDPNFGFEHGRQERVMIATEEQMISAKIPLEERDYCAHKKLDWLACRADVWPWVYKCHDAKHEVLHCLYDDYIIRMKEFEREKRLLRRQHRLTGKAE